MIALLTIRHRIKTDRNTGRSTSRSTGHNTGRRTSRNSIRTGSIGSMGTRYLSYHLELS